MIDLANIPPVADDELLARFILHSNEMRKDGTVYPKLFLPYKKVDLSVNRHRDASQTETWSVGNDIAKQRNKKLYGRADIRVSSCQISPLRVVKTPILPGNPNHADITGFPHKKEEQLSFATKLAASIESRWIETPNEFGVGEDS